MPYFDTTYLVRLHTKDAGWQSVRALAATDNIACGLHGQAEVVSAFHRKFREGTVNQKELRTLLLEFDKDCSAGGYRWLPLSPAVIVRLTQVYAALSSTFALRAADALHLACAVDAGFSTIHSNDVRLLDAAAHFGLKGVNVI